MSVSRHRVRPAPCLRHALAVLLLPLMLGGCAGEAFVDSRREAGLVEPVGASTADRPVICYAPGETTEAELYAMAQEVCARTNRTARFVGVKKWQCRMMTPHRAIFACQ